MLKKIPRFFLLICLLFLTIDTKVAEAIKNPGNYEFYPKPHQIDYLEKEHSLDQIDSYFLSDHLKENSKNYLFEVFPSLEKEEVFDSDKKQALIVLLNDNSLAEKFILENYPIDKEFLNKKEAYYLNTEEDLIIYAKNNEAAYHAIATLQQIIAQKEENKESIAIHDYADTSFRGFIEGFYGEPWTMKERISLMAFGRDFKLNRYIFAPKDDPYHNKKWRESYPEEELDNLEALIKKSEKKNIEFIWTINPFMETPFDFKEDYEEDLTAIIQKFEQLYEIGVRQFGVLADDVDKEAFDAENQLKLMKDLNEWNAKKEANKNLLFVPSAYNTDWAEQYGTYFQDLKALPEDIHVMWTGAELMGKIEQESVNYFKNQLNREPLFWLNWPVNDNIPVRLSLGKTEMINPNTTDLAGVMTNPMKEAEASKGALFTIADYSWNSETFDIDQNWKDSFKYIEAEEYENLRLVARHLNDQAPVIEFEESEILKEELSHYLEELENDSLSDRQRNQLMTEFEKISEAILALKNNAENQQYIEEVTPWLNSLKDLADSSLNYLKAEKALSNHKEKEFEDYFFKAADLKEQSENYKIETIEGPFAVQAGSKRLVPFNNDLNSYLSQNAPSEGAPLLYISGAVLILTGLSFLYFKREKPSK